MRQNTRTISSGGGLAEEECGADHEPESIPRHRILFRLTLCFWRGHLWGVIRRGETFEPLHKFSLVGPGMHSVFTLPWWEGLWEGEVDAQNSRHTHNSALVLGAGGEVRVRWSRTIGALRGEEIWERLIGLHIAIIGCGRTGSLVAVTLARLGIRQLTLIDPDIVEPHNLGEMDAMTDADLGRPKAEAIADHLHSLLKPRLSEGHRVFPSIVPIVTPITDPTALKAAKKCDVLFCCADNDAAHLATAILATLYHKVLMDIGTGIFYQNQISPPHTPRMMGADIRLILPDDGCLLCRGNLSNYTQAVEDLCNNRSLAGLQQEDWNRQRAGSLRSLNQLAAALGVQMLQDLVAERIQASTWAHLEFDNAGRLTFFRAGQDGKGRPFLTPNSSSPRISRSRMRFW